MRSCRNVGCGQVEGHGDAVGLVVAHEVEQHRREAVDGVGDLAAGKGDVGGEGEEGPVGERVPVDQHHGGHRGRTYCPSQAMRPGRCAPTPAYAAQVAGNADEASGEGLPRVRCEVGERRGIGADREEDGPRDRQHAERLALAAQPPRGHGNVVVRRVGRVELAVSVEQEVAPPHHLSGPQPIEEPVDLAGRVAGHPLVDLANGRPNLSASRQCDGNSTAPATRGHRGSAARTQKSSPCATAAPARSTAPTSAATSATAVSLPGSASTRLGVVDDDAPARARVDPRRRVAGHGWSSARTPMAGHGEPGRSRPSSPSQPVDVTPAASPRRR